MQVPAITGLVLTWDRQYSAKRPGIDTKTTFTPSYETLDIGVRYSIAILARTANWRLSLNTMGNAHCGSTIGPSNIAGTNLGNMVARIGAPRTVAASVSLDL